ADLRAEDFFAPAGCGRLRVQRAQLLVRLLHRIGVDACGDAVSADASPALCGVGVAAAAARIRIWGRRLVVVHDPFRRAAVRLQLRLDPVHGRAVAIRALPPIAELGQTFDGRLVLLEVETAGERADVVAGGRGGRRSLLSETDDGEYSHQNERAHGSSEPESLPEPASGEPL